MKSLSRYAWLSVAAAVLTITLKSAAYLLTGSVGLLSDALESVVNLASALIALWVLILAVRPPDADHPYGHGKAEYFSSGTEGGLILLAALSIAWTAVERLLHPHELSQLGVGLAVSVVAGGVNFGVAWVLFRAARRYESITLEADARHLMTDVWTSVGVVVGVAAVAVTGWQKLDPLIAIAVAANIVWSGAGLIRRSSRGLMDVSLPADEQQAIQNALTRYREQGIEFHALLTRQAGARRFVSVHVLVPGQWTVRQGHELLETIEADIRHAVPHCHVTTHLEPLADPAAFSDEQLDRADEQG